MAIRKQTLLKEYRDRLDGLYRELTRWPSDGIEAARFRDLIAHYERQIRDLERPKKQNPK